RLDDFGSEDRLELLGIRVFVPEIPENIPAPSHHFQLFPFHHKISFSAFKRSSIRLLGGRAAAVAPQEVFPLVEIRGYGDVEKTYHHLFVGLLAPAPLVVRIGIRRML